MTHSDDMESDANSTVANTPPGSSSAVVSPHSPLTVDLPILAVDDEPAILKALARTLNYSGWQIDLATNAAEALERLEAKEYSVVVSDYRMPGMDGLSFLSRVRDRFPDMQRIIISACADEEALERAINDAAVHRILRKPWRADSLREVVAQAMAHNRTRREVAILNEQMRHRNEELLYLNERLSNSVAKGNEVLHTVRRRWDVALDAISDAILIVDENLVIEGVNKVAAKLAGKVSDEMEGRACHKALFERHAPCPECPMGSGASRIRTLLRQDSREHVFDARSYLLPGDRPAYLCIYRDITQVMELERQAAHMEKMAAIGRLAGGVAHELNNPLHVIFTFGQLAEQSQVPPEKMTRYLQVIRESAVRCRDIVRALRDFARQDQNGEHQLVDLNAICKNAVDLMGKLSSHRLEMVPAATPLHCMGNANQLHQVIVNLVQNAVDASPKEGLIRIGFQCSADELCLYVEDQGPGVPEAERGRIFEPFFTTKPEGVGTGLGLAISHGIINEHGGSLTVGVAELGGARFEARLPRRYANENGINQP